MSYKVEQITDPLDLGEGPHWDERTQALYFTAIHQHTIHKYVLATGKHTKAKLDGPVGFVIPVEGKPDQFVAGLGKKVVVVEWDGRDHTARVMRELFEIDQDRPRNRFNDGKVDPTGRLYAGTMGHEEPAGVFEQGAGSLFRVDGDKKISKLDSGIGISNGLAWDERAKAMYYVDSLEKNVRRYDWDADTGDISNKKYIFDIQKNGLSGFGDGATIDTDGNLWLALFTGSCVVKLDPSSGQLLQKVDIPAEQVTSCTFGGPNLDILFVTTAGLPIDGKIQKPPCGCVFKVTGLGVKGQPNMNFKL